MVRRDNPLVEKYGIGAPGVMIERNPGVMAIWETNDWKLFPDGLGQGGKLIKLGDPVAVTWWHEGRRATRQEAIDRIDAGLPILRKGCHGDKQYLRLLAVQHREALKYLPL